MEKTEILRKLSRHLEKIAERVDPQPQKQPIPAPEPTPPAPPAPFTKDAPPQGCKHVSRSGKLCGAKSTAPYCGKHIGLKCHAEEVGKLGVQIDYEQRAQKNRDYQRKHQERKKAVKPIVVREAEPDDNIEDAPVPEPDE